MYAGIFAGKRPRNLGVAGGKLAPCPSSPNCVCSQSAGAHHVEPLLFGSDPDKEMARLKDLLVTIPGIQVIEFTGHYLRAECTTRFMGFVDDLEFFWSSEGGVCHIRSASRLGHSDFGKNRKRVEAIRALFTR